jgi:hypothetical protein
MDPDPRHPGTDPDPRKLFGSATLIINVSAEVYMTGNHIPTRPPPKMMFSLLPLYAMFFFPY